MRTSEAAAGRRVRTLVGALAVLAALSVAGTVLTTAPASALTSRELTDEVDYVRRINEVRRANGLRPVVEDVELSRKARDWSVHMANGWCGLIPLCHDPDLAGGISANWTKLGENVAYANIGNNAQVMSSFMNSTLHRQNILDPSFTRVGVGVIHRNGLQHVTHKFMAVHGEVIASNAPLSQRYVDVRYDHLFYRDIEWLSSNRIAFGDAYRMFRPGGAVSRQEMAAFLYRLAGSPAGPFPNPGFSDVKAGHPFLKEISWLVHEGVGQGFPDGTFRPTRSTDRAAASAYLHALDGGPAGPFPNPGFRDVGPGHLFYTPIAWFKAEGVGDGYPDGTFRPGHAVSRQEMAAFLYRYAQR